MSNRPPKQHFRVFDTFRFLAFFKVFLQHLPISSWVFFNIIKGGGAIGVQFFFVLSGFLITYIILYEKTQEHFHLKHFFIRRILRIWPLFYAIVGVAYLMPMAMEWLHIHRDPIGYQPNWLISALFLENYKMIFMHSLPNIPELAVTWSLCVEEHFYIIWGITMFFLPARHFLKLPVLCIIVGFISRLFFYRCRLDPTDIFTNIDLFAFGSLPAYFLIFHKEECQQIAGRLPSAVHMLLHVLVIATVLWAGQVKDIIANFIWFPTMFGVLFSGVIFLAINRNGGKGGIGVLNKAGVYTYGLYLYHLLFIDVLARIFGILHWSLEKPVFAVAFVIASLAITLGWSAISYHYFEKPILLLKKYFR